MQFIPLVFSICASDGARCLPLKCMCPHTCPTFLSRRPDFPHFVCMCPRACQTSIWKDGRYDPRQCVSLSMEGKSLLSVLCVVRIIIKLFRNEDFVGEFGEFRRGTSKSTSEPVGLNFRRSTPNRWTKIWHILPIAISPVLF